MEQDRDSWSRIWKGDREIVVLLLPNLGRDWHLIFLVINLGKGLGLKDLVSDL